MPAGRNGFPAQILQDPRIVALDAETSGVILKQQKADDWSSIDSQLAQVEAAGKQVILGMVSGGINILIGF